MTGKHMINLKESSAPLELDLIFLDTFQVLQLYLFINITYAVVIVVEVLILHQPTFPTLTVREKHPVNNSFLLQHWSYNWKLIFNNKLFLSLV